jgi:predicted oxidoreductase
MSLLPLPPATRKLGTSSLRISPMAWGMWRLVDGGHGAADAARLIHTALDAGITLMDTADIYGFNGKSGFGDAETVLGQVLRAEPALRDRMVLSTKGGIRPPLPYDQSANWLEEAIDASLTRLGVEAIDLWHVHRPDILAHPQEVAGALDKAVQAGKIRTLGVSNFTVAQIAALNHFLDHKLSVTQPEISPLRLACIENGELDQAMVLGLRPLAWSPLGGGRLADPQSPRDKAVADALDKVAQDKGISRVVAAYSWLMAHPAGIVPIIGSQNPERIVEGASAAQVQWSRQDWYDVLVAARGEALP